MHFAFSSLEKVLKCLECVLKVFCDDCDSVTSAVTLSVILHRFRRHPRYVEAISRCEFRTRYPTTLYLGSLHAIRALSGQLSLIEP